MQPSALSIQLSPARHHCKSNSNKDLKGATCREDDCTPQPTLCSEHNNHTHNASHATRSPASYSTSSSYVRRTLPSTAASTPKRPPTLKRGANTDGHGTKHLSFYNSNTSSTRLSSGTNSSQAPLRRSFIKSRLLGTTTLPPTIQHSQALLSLVSAVSVSLSSSPVQAALQGHKGEPHFFESELLGDSTDVSSEETLSTTGSSSTYLASSLREPSSPSCWLSSTHGSATTTRSDCRLSSSSPPRIPRSSVSSKGPPVAAAIASAPSPVSTPRKELTTSVFRLWLFYSFIAFLGLLLFFSATHTFRISVQYQPSGLVTSSVLETFALDPLKNLLKSWNVWPSTTLDSEIATTNVTAVATQAEEGIVVRLSPAERLNSIEKLQLSKTAVERSPETKALRVHSEEFVRRIERVVQNVFVAIGYGLANVLIVETRHDGLILIDTMESIGSMRNVMAAWIEFKRRQLTNTSPRFAPLGQCPSPFTIVPKPRVLIIIYSHFHSDHIFGAAEVYTPGVTKVIAHETTDKEIDKVFKVTAGITYKRSMRQFGNLLTEAEGYINAGIGPRLYYDASDPESTGIVPPTHVWSGKKKLLKLAGETIELIHAPGESKDQVIAIFPEKDLIFGSDNIYRSLPNIYAIRGTETRDTLAWVKSLDLMRSIRPEFLALGHTGVLRGREYIWDTLTAYRDAIQFIHDQTVRHMNKGYTIDEIVDTVKLPEHLASHPFLQPYYGTAEWAVRAVFHHYLGWFTGEAEQLDPLSGTARAERLVKVAGGMDELLSAALSALENGDPQWAAELSSAALKVNPSCPVARRLKATSFRILAKNHRAATGRNWYLTAAREIESELEYKQKGARKLYTAIKQSWRGSTSAKQNLGSAPELSESEADSSSPTVNIHERMRLSKNQKDQCISRLKSIVESFDFLPVRLRANESLHTDTLADFTFTDTGEKVCTHFRRGVAYSTRDCERRPDIEVTTSDVGWRQLVTQEISPFTAVSSGKLRIKGGPKAYWTFKRTMDLIEIEAE